MSKEKYYLRNATVVIGHFINSKGKLSYTPAVENGSDLFYPIGLYPIDESKLPKIVPIKNYVPKGSDIREWLGERVFPADRQGSHLLLNSLNISKYDEWEIAKKTKAITANDFYWMTSNFADRFEDVHPRAAYNKISNARINPKHVKRAKNLALNLQRHANPATRAQEIFKRITEQNKALRIVIKPIVPARITAPIKSEFLKSILSDPRKTVINSLPENQIANKINKKVFFDPRKNG